VSGKRQADVRFYIDADTLGLAHVLAALRADVTYPGDPGAVIKGRVRPACPVVTPATPDPEWIPAVTRRRWLIVTRDRQIRHHRAEIGAARTYGARLVALSGEEAQGTFAQLEIVMCQWRAIEKLLDLDGPFIYTATRTRLDQVDLD
jgi:hypothetical protein